MAAHFFMILLDPLSLRSLNVDMGYEYQEMTRRKLQAVFSIPQYQD